MSGSLTKMTDLEINQKIATNIKRWTPIEDGWYDDGSGFYNPLPDYCNSIAHALDLAKVHGIGLKPVEAGWEEYNVANPTSYSTDAVAAKAICLCLLIDSQIQS
jgi:hypothetical protein